MMMVIARNCARVIDWGVSVVSMSGLNGGKYFFNAVREGDQIMFATDDEAECGLWVQAIYRATGQSHKPVPPVSQPTKVVCAQLSKVQGGQSVVRVVTSLRFTPYCILPDCSRGGSRACL